MTLVVTMFLMESNNIMVGDKFNQALINLRLWEQALAILGRILWTMLPLVWTSNLLYFLSFLSFYFSYHIVLDHFKSHFPYRLYQA